MILRSSSIVYVVGDLGIGFSMRSTDVALALAICSQSFENETSAICQIDLGPQSVTLTSCVRCALGQNDLCSSSRYVRGSLSVRMLTPKRMEIDHDHDHVPVHDPVRGHSRGLALAHGGRSYHGRMDHATVGSGRLENVSGHAPGSRHLDHLDRSHDRLFDLHVDSGTALALGDHAPSSERFRGRGGLPRRVDGGYPR